MTFDFSKVDIQILSESQKGQDSVLKYIFDTIGSTNKFYAEFGGYDGVQMCNTHYFKHFEAWRGILIDNQFENEAIGLYKRHLTRDNIVAIFRELGVPDDLDLLCIDVDGNDFWFLQSLLTFYKPRVIMTEVNTRFQPLESYCLKYNEKWQWDGRKWYGASPFAFKKLVNRYDYTPVYIHIDDMIIVRNDLLDEEQINKDWLEIYPKANSEIYAKQTFGKLPIIKEMPVDEWISI